jgi:hypothetical protein
MNDLITAWQTPPQATIALLVCIRGFRHPRNHCLVCAGKISQLSTESFVETRIWGGSASRPGHPNLDRRQPVAARAACLLLQRLRELRPLLPITEDEIFETGQLFGPHRTARVHFTSCDANFCAHAKLASVGELR